MKIATLTLALLLSSAAFADDYDLPSHEHPVFTKKETQVLGALCFVVHGRDPEAPLKYSHLESKWNLIHFSHTINNDLRVFISNPIEGLVGCKFDQPGDPKKCFARLVETYVEKGDVTEKRDVCLPPEKPTP